MKKNTFYLLLFFLSTGFISSPYAGATDIVKQYTNYSTDRPWVSLGTYYGLFIQTNLPSSSGNGTDAFMEIYMTRFLSLYTGYQYMSYDWKNRQGNQDLLDNRFLLGGRLYVGTVFIGGGVFGTWSEMTTVGSKSRKSYWGGYTDFGYQYAVLDFLTIETGGRFYFTTHKSTSGPNILYTHNKSSGGIYYHWDWFTGIKFLI